GTNFVRLGASWGRFTLHFSLAGRFLCAIVSWKFPKKWRTHRERSPAATPEGPRHRPAHDGGAPEERLAHGRGELHRPSDGSSKGVTNFSQPSAYHGPPPDSASSSVSSVRRGEGRFSLDSPSSASEKRGGGSLTELTKLASRGVSSVLSVGGGAVF